jgi:3-dehydroquinate dehydratase/shikimate dehydrogenase
MASAGFDGVYVPLLVDDMQEFLDSIPDGDWSGLSVTIPHKEAALRGAGSADVLAQQIGAANTLVRQPDGSLKAYNTDCSAAIHAIERGLVKSLALGDHGASRAMDSSSPLKGRTVVILGAGGAGRAVAFGAIARGARVVVANRTAERAEELVRQLGSDAIGASLASVSAGEVSGDVLVNTTSVGMHPKQDETPIPSEVLGAYKVVFDAVYTPLLTRLLREAAHAGCAVVTGDEMFVGQAADQFRLFTEVEPPVELMRQVVLDSLKKE